MPNPKNPSQTSRKTSRKTSHENSYGATPKHSSKDSPKDSSGKKFSGRKPSEPHARQARAPRPAQNVRDAQNHAGHEETHLVRINKALADAGVCSRRKAEELIAAGKVFVNGERIINLGHKVSPHDVLRVDGQTIVRESARSYLLMHKPIQTLCTAHDPEGRTTIFDILPATWRHKRLFTVGRLDYFSEGLLLLTDDGNFAQRLAHPRYHLPKIYEVWVRETVNNTHIDRMQSGMTLEEGEKLAPVKARVLRREARSTLLELTLHQGINRQIRRMCRDLQLTILKLTRVVQGPIELDIPVGKVRELSAQELKALHKAVGL